ncbi:hypothetical protein Vadar_034805 [Vaccinium darrowii]|uniref:Uncharacterized protein n=1 Tax=Vaccinium darrowii TaxID=229202 RepID=A0ACB7ZPZ4_9ERIC|nr:hypothetical protein Vadar_034805 [Vaccinium darrowii]
MADKKRSRTAYSKLSQEEKDAKNARRRQQWSDLSQAKKDAKNARRRELRLLKKQPTNVASQISPDEKDVAADLEPRQMVGEESITAGTLQQIHDPFKKLLSEAAHSTYELVVTLTYKDRLVTTYHDLVTITFIQHFGGDYLEDSNEKRLKVWQDMTTGVTMIKDIRPGQSNWTAEVMVIEKGFPRLTQNKKLYQKLVFIDAEGTIFEEDMPILKDTLNIYRTYSISNAIVNGTPTDHRVIDNDFQWLLYARTPIEETVVEALSIRALKYNFIPLGQLYKYDPTEGLAMKLQTRGSSTFVFNPALPEASALQTWCMAQSTAITKLPSIDLGHLGTVQVSPPHRNQIKKINRLPTTVEEDETHWIQVMCKVVDYNQKFYYMSCSKCIKGTAARGNTPFWCNYCKQRVLPTPRCKFNIELSDSTGIIVATLFGEKAESMFSIDGEYLRENIQQDQLSDVAMEKLGTGIEYAVQVRAYKYEAREVALCLFNVNAFFPTNEIIEDILQLTLEPETPAKKQRKNESKDETSSAANDDSTVVSEEHAPAVSNNLKKNEDHTKKPRNGKTKKD